MTQHTQREEQRATERTIHREQSRAHKKDAFRAGQGSGQGPWFPARARAGGE